MIQNSKRYISLEIRQYPEWDQESYTGEADNIQELNFADSVKRVFPIHPAVNYDSNRMGKSTSHLIHFASSFSLQVLLFPSLSWISGKLQLNDVRIWQVEING